MLSDQSTIKAGKRDMCFHLYSVSADGCDYGWPIPGVIFKVVVIFTLAVQLAHSALPDGGLEFKRLPAVLIAPGYLVSERFIISLSLSDFNIRGILCVLAIHCHKPVAGSHW